MLLLLHEYSTGLACERKFLLGTSGSPRASLSTFSVFKTWRSLIFSGWPYRYLEHHEWFETHQYGILLKIGCSVEEGRTKSLSFGELPARKDIMYHNGYLNSYKTLGIFVLDHSR